jgi:cytidylate kinase
VAVITVTRQYGSGGSKVAALVAAQLGWTLVDNEFVEEVARSAGLSVATVVALEERAPSLKERLVSALATASPEVFVPTSAPTDEEKTEERIVRHTERVIAEAAQHGRVVLVGRGAQAVLASATPELALHVYVIAPHEERVRTIMRRLSVDAREAGRVTDQTDANRDRYVERWYGRRRQDPANYHLVVNTTLLGYEGAAELVVTAARRKGWS